jgi:ABC-type polysaccharide/polyol phosphate export permease
VAGWRAFRALLGRELGLRQRGAWLGVLWPLLDPLLLVGAYALLLGGVFGLRDVAAAPALAAGVLPWSLLAATLAGAATALPVAGPLLRALAVEPWLLALAPAALALPGFLVGLALFLAVFGGSPVAALAMSLLYLPFLAGLASGLALASVHLRDVAVGIHPALRLGFFLTPVLYPASQLPAPLDGLAWINPATPFFEGWRQALLQGALPSPSVVAGALAWTTLFAGLAALGWTWARSDVAALA